MNRGGRRFLQRRHGNDNGKNDDENRHYQMTKQYPRSLWPLIINRLLNEMDFKIHYICSSDESKMVANGYTTNISVRRCSVVYSLMINGIVTDLLSVSSSSSSSLS